MGAYESKKKLKDCSSHSFHPISHTQFSNFLNYFITDYFFEIYNIIKIKAFTESQKGIKLILMRNPTTVPKVIPRQNQSDSLGESEA